MKKFSSIILIALMSVLMAINSFAAQWIQVPDGRWWYQHDDGGYTTNNWELIDGKYYYFDGEGWMLANTTTPDGYRVGPDGAWIEGAAAAERGYRSDYTLDDLVAELNAEAASDEVVFSHAGSMLICDMYVTGEALKDNAERQEAVAVMMITDAVLEGTMKEAIREFSQMTGKNVQYKANYYYNGELLYTGKI